MEKLASLDNSMSHSELSRANLERKLKTTRNRMQGVKKAKKPKTES